MSILVTGGAGSGSWAVRGEQLGHAIGAHVDRKHFGVLSHHSLVVLVKHPFRDIVQRIHKAGLPLVWDIVDAWPQPGGNAWDDSQAMSWLRSMVETIRPAGIVAATECMAGDCAQFGVPVFVLPHHARSGMRRNPIRERVHTVGYEGSEHHIGAMAWTMRNECARRGWQFVVNPPELADVDIVVALREHHGYPPRHWKSNIKLANAQASGTPCVLNRECGYLETRSGGERWADTPAEVSQALDELIDVDVRHMAQAKLLSHVYTLEAMAERYGRWLHAQNFLNHQLTVA